MLDFLMTKLPTGEEINGTYFEPFLGGGIVFFSINPKKAVLSDLNKDLIDLYTGIRFDPKGVWQIYSEFGETKQDYLFVRDEYSYKILKMKAARILFLNRTCFKGMWRHNKQGNFNVGYGGQDRRWVISEENLIEVSTTLKKTKIRCKDFEKVIIDAKEGDFIFADPPYKPGEKEQSQSHYLNKRFSFDDHKRLSNALNDATTRKVKWALTISAHPEILGLYSQYNYDVIPRGTGKKPGSTIDNSGEVLIRNY